MQSTPSLEKRLTDFVSEPGYSPLKQHELARALHLKGSERAALRQLLRELERQGRLVCLRKNRWALPPSNHFVKARLGGLPSGAAVATTEDRREFFVPADALGGAIHGDTVLLHLAGRSRRIPRALPAREEARVARVIARESRTLAGRLQRTRYYWYVIPEHARVTQNVRVVGFASGVRPAERNLVTVSLEDWAGPGAPLKGTVVEDLGPADGPGQDLTILMRNHQLDDRFDDGLLEEARQRSPTLREHDLDGREDLRGLLTFTVDPEDARDFDDAVSLMPAEDGQWDVGIHIADVSHFVRPGTAVDREAYRRGNSVYLVGGFVPMLPKHLTSDVCSLRPHVDRLTHSVLLRLDAHGRVLRSRTVPSVIHSAARLDYDQVQRYFDLGAADDIPPAVRSALDSLRDLARRLRQRRMSAGSIDLSMPEVKCVLDAEGRPVDLHRRGAPEAYHLIEELMLLANVAVAERLSAKRIPALYRIHEEPSDDQWARMAADLARLGVHRQPQDCHEINRICRDAAERPAAHVVNLAVLRNLKRALYSDEALGHFGLGFAKYTHFTSPIRRYPDLVVHRLLCALESRTRIPYSHEDIRTIARHCSQTEREADEAEEESLTIKRIAYYADRLAKGERGPFRALVTGVVARGVLVEIHDTLQRGMIPLAQLGSDYYDPDPEAGVVRGRRGWTLRVGQVAEVELLRVDESRRLVDFRLVRVERTARVEPQPASAPVRNRRRRRQRIR